MSDNFISIVATKKEVADPEKAASKVLKWLQDQQIVDTHLSDCTLGETGYDIGPNAKHWVKTPEYLPEAGGVSGLEIITELTPFDPIENFEEGMEIPTSNLGFTFWNWQTFNREFLVQLQTLTGEEFTIVYGRI